MLRLIVPGDEFFDEEEQEFITVGDVVLELEHSLVSVSKWESKFEKAFLTSTQKTSEEIYEYIRCMILTPDVGPNVLMRFDQDILEKIQVYLNSKQSATTFGNMPERPGGRGESITSELIYYWMIAFTIPFECQHWHLNRLFALIRICNLKNSPQKKMSRHDIASRNRALNEQRKAKYGTTG